MAGIKYDERQDQRWMADVLKLDSEVREGVVRYKGPCPACTHELTVDVPIPLDFPSFDVFVDEEGAGEKKPQPADDGRLRCNCTSEHEGRDAANRADGCGVYGYAYL